MTDLNQRLDEHFIAREFQCHDDTALPDDFADTIDDTVEFLERLRGFQNFWLYQKKGKWLDLGIRVISGYRSLKYNREKCPASTDDSRHIYGQAADVQPIGGFLYGFSYSDFFQMCLLVDRSYKDRPYRIGKYTRSGFVHIDCGYGHGGRRW